MRCFFFLHEKRFNVLPRVCKTDLVQIAIAAASFAFALDFAMPGRSLTVLRTDFIHLQNFVPKFFIYLYLFFSSLALEEWQPPFKSTV